MQFPEHPVAGGGTGRRRQDAVAFQVADLLNAVPGPPGDVDRAHSQRVETFRLVHLLS
nr:hypothetical protein [Micromonospora sp. Llam0]